MVVINSTIQYYSENADQFYQKYQKLQFEEINAPWLHLIPPVKIWILDVGAGSGRDVSWLAQKGHNIVAVEPADRLRELAERKHSNCSIRWIKDRLPGIQKVNRLGLKFDLILVNAVWMHIDPRCREKAFSNLTQLLATDGNLVMTLRYGSSPDKRVMHPICAKELIRLANIKGLELKLNIQSDDLYGRTDVSWETFAFHRPQGRSLKMLDEF